MPTSTHSAIVGRMSHRHAICLVVDGLRASALGAYGNTTYPTPQLDSLASRALVVDWLWADSPYLPHFYRSAWQGLHALRPDVAGEQKSVLAQLQRAGVRQWLVTDDSWLIDHAEKLPFDETLLIENGARHAASQLEDTALGRFFTEAIEELHQWRADVDDVSSMGWLHCRGMVGPWDAPQELRDNLLDDEDPPAPEFVEPPTALREIDDPDVLLAHRVAYAAQIAVLDACVGAFVRAVEEAFENRETLITLAGSRGFALGEHGSIGTDCAELYSERLHLPWFLSPCGNTAPLPRLATLAQPADLGATLLDWLCGGETAVQSDGISYLPLLTHGVGNPRQLVIAAGDKEERAIRTPAWMLTQGHSKEQSVELYTKPDDRWERNDIAALCPEVVQQLSEELAGSQQCCREGKRLPLTPRDRELIVSLR